MSGENLIIIRLITEYEMRSRCHGYMGLFGMDMMTKEVKEEVEER